MYNALQYSHQLITSKVQPGDLAIDATAGKGHDTLLLAQLVGKTGLVISYDIQEFALNLTRIRLEKEGLVDRVQLFQRGHETMEQDIPASKGIRAATFNLGYLPGGDHTIITKPETTLKAIQITMNHLLDRGIITIVAYHGHPGGQEELSYLEEFLYQINQNTFDVLKYQFINQINQPPILFVIEKKRTAGLKV